MRKVYDQIIDMRGNLLTVRAKGVKLGELARIEHRSGKISYASVIRLEGEKATLQSFEGTRGVHSNDKVMFLGREIRAIYGDALLGRRFNGLQEPLDGGPQLIGDSTMLGTPSFNPVRRVVPHQMVRTNIPMIEVFNCLVK